MRAEYELGQELLNAWAILTHCQKMGVREGLLELTFGKVN